MRAQVLKDCPGGAVCKGATLMQPCKKGFYCAAGEQPVAGPAAGGAAIQIDAPFYNLHG
jgi:hypothetical protein